MTLSCELTTGHVKSNSALDILLIVTGSFIMALLSQVEIILPFTPVPITLQAQTALLLGALLGPKEVLLQLLYIFAKVQWVFPCSLVEQQGLIT